MTTLHRRVKTMPKGDTELVKIQRGQHSHHFQVARANLSAASALVSINSKRATHYLDGAIDELTNLRAKLVGEAR